jgi:hypothetical protein
MTVQDQVFLYCFVIYEQQNEEILKYLPPTRAETMRKELKKFERFPKEVRLTMTLKLLAHLVQHAQNPHLEMIHPTWMADILGNQSPQVLFDILDQFPEEYARQVVAHVGAAVEPVDNPMASLSADTVHVILRLLSKHFAPMSASSGEPDLTLETLYLLREEDLLLLMKHIGILEMARAFTLAGIDIMAAVYNRFPAEMREDFLNAVRIAKSESTEKQKIATKRMSKIDLTSLSLEEATLKVGLMKAGSVLHEKGELARKIAQRMPMNLGMILLQTETEEGATEDEMHEIMTVIADMIERNRIDKDYIKARFSAINERLSFRAGM